MSFVRFYILTIVFTAGFVPVFAKAGRSDLITLGDLDAIVAEAPNFDAFMANSDQAVERRERYFSALQEYYGADRFPKSSFDAIIKQLLEASARIPELGPRLWETSGLGVDFKLDAVVRSSGLEIKNSEWMIRLLLWRSELAETAEMIDSLDLENRFELISRTLEHWSNRVAALTAMKFTNAQRNEQNRLSKSLFNEMAANPEFAAVSAWIVQQAVSAEQNIDLLSSGDADLVLNVLEQFRTGKIFRSINYFVNKSPIKIPENLLTSIARQHAIEATVPKLEVRNGIAAETDFFRVTLRRTRSGSLVPVGASGNSTYDFVPLPRRIHGIWKGVPLAECVGGNCGSLNSLTPERWATIALKNSQIHHVERNGSYLGFTQYVPLEDSQSHRIRASVDFGAPVMGRKIWVKGGGGSLLAKPFFEAWLPVASRHLPTNWRGLMVGNSNAINNAGVLQTLRQSPSYGFGIFLGDANHYRHLDSLAQQIVNLNFNGEFTQSYRGKMILDATVQGTQNLTRLGSRGFAFLNSDVAMKLFSVKDTKKVVAYLKAYNSHPALFTEPQVQMRLVNLLTRSDSEIRNAVIGLLRNISVSDKRVIGLIISMLNNPDEIISSASIRVLKNFDSSGEIIVSDLLNHLRDSPGFAIRRAIEVFNNMKSRPRVDPAFQSLIAGQLYGSGVTPYAAAELLIRMAPEDLNVLAQIDRTIREANGTLAVGASTTKKLMRMADGADERLRLSKPEVLANTCDRIFDNEK